MLNYRRYSIIGFAAYLGVVTALRDDNEAAKEFVVELTRSGSQAGQFVAINVIENYSILNPSFTIEALEIVRNEMLEPVLDDVHALSHLLICAAGIVETDINQLWVHFEPILDSALDYVLSAYSEENVLRFFREMRCMAFFSEISVGTNMVEYLISRGYLDDESPWRTVSLEICAGMLIRRRSEFVRIVEKNGFSDELVREAHAFRTQAVLDQQRTFGARARWNIFFCKSLATNKKLSYLLITYMLGPLARCNSVEEWSKQMGTFMIESIRAYSEDTDDPDRYERVTIEDIERATPFRPIPGGGRAYIPKR